MSQKLSDIGLVGLAVIGQNLALNIADHGFQISVYNRTTETMEKFLAENPNTPGGLVGEATLEGFRRLRSPSRGRLLFSSNAGKPTDAVISSLEPLLEARRHHYRRRERAVDGHDPAREGAFGQGFPVCRFRVWGGGGAVRPFADAGRRPVELRRVQPIWDAIAAKVDAETGKPLTGATPAAGEGRGACTTYIGPNGAGHYVKMVHNGIEYGDMQMICEAYAILTQLGGLIAGRVQRGVRRVEPRGARQLPDPDYGRYSAAERPDDGGAVLSISCSIRPAGRERAGDGRV
jgi:6-phosphogluconate dehydrogenase